MSCRPRGCRRRIVRTRGNTSCVETLESRRLLSGAGTGALSQAYGKLPLAFESNRGQTDAQVQFLSRGAGYALFVTPTETVLSLQKSAAPGANPAQAEKSTVLRMRLVGASASPTAVGLDRLPGASNYLIGNDPTKWHTNVPSFARVEERGVYPGVDLTYYGDQRQLEYDFTVAPGARPGVIRLAFQGADSKALDAKGNLVLHTSGGDVVEHAPVLYQETNGVRRTVPGHYAIGADGLVGFAVGAYDPSKPLVIDPVLSYSTYLGGSGTGNKGEDLGYSIAVDAAGSAYVTGFTESTSFPTANPLQPASGGGFGDAFVAKLNPAGSALVYSTYLGGSLSDFAIGIAVDSAGSAYVTGYTGSTDFPTKNPLQPALGSFSNAFVAKLNPAGSALVYSTYLGGSGFDRGYGIAVDAAGSAYVTGETRSTNFPTASPLQPAIGSSRDAFVAKLNPAGSAPVYSTYLGGSGNDYGYGIAVDSAGSAYLTGTTESTNFPTANPLQPASNGGGDAFVAKLNPAGSALVYSTYLGGSFLDQGHGIAVDSAGSAYVTGTTESTNFPTANPLQPANGGLYDAFVAKLNPAGSALVYSTYLGGSGYENNNGLMGNAIAVDATGDAYVTGTTISTDFPTKNPLQPANNGGGGDAFVAELNAAGSALVYSTYLGGNGPDYGNGIAVDAAGSAYVTGVTGSTNFPTKNPFQPANNGGGGVAGGPYYLDAFVAKITPGQTVNSTPPSVGFVIGTDDQVYTRALDASGNPTGGYYLTAFGRVKDLAATRLGGPANFEAFVIGTNNLVYAETISGATRSDYFATAYGAIASISAGTDAAGNPLLFAIGADNQLYEQKFDGTGRAASPSYTKAAFGDFKQTFLTHDAAGNPLLYAVGQDDQIYGLKMNATGTPTGGLFKVDYGPVKQLAVGHDAAGNPEVFVIGTDNAVYAHKLDATGSPLGKYLGLGGAARSISVTGDAGKNPELFAIGSDGQVYAHKFVADGRPTGNFFGAPVLAGGASAIVAGAGPNGTPEVFAVDSPDAQVYAAPFDGTGNSAGPFALTSAGKVKKIAVV